MTKFNNKTFSVGANSKEAAKNYSDNWDRIFGKKETFEEFAEKVGSLPTRSCNLHDDCAALEENLGKKVFHCYDEGCEDHK